MATADATDGQDGWVCLCWTTVEEADSYEIWRELMVAVGWDDAGNLVELDTPKPVWVPWGIVTRPEDQGPVLCAVIATLDERPHEMGRLQRRGRRRLGTDNSR